MDHMTGRKPKTQGRLERQKQWKDHFDDMEIHSDKEISNCFTMEELNAVLKASNAGKAPGLY